MKLSIDELAVLAGVSVRTIRYLLSAGDLAPPEVNGRRGEFSPEHLRSIIDILRRTSVVRKPTEACSDGRPPQEGEITTLLRCTVSDGIDVLVDLHRAGLTRQQVQTLFSDISRMTRIAQSLEQDSTTNEFFLMDATPQGTIALLEKLKLLGFTETAFGVIHDKPGETIEKHLGYVRGVDSFRSNSRNVFVNHRLQMCLHEAESRRESGHPLGPSEWSEIALTTAKSISTPQAAG